MKAILWLFGMLGLGAAVGLLKVVLDALASY